MLVDSMFMIVLIFPNRTVKTFSVVTHLFRDIVLYIRKSIRWGTFDSMELYKWDYVDM